MGEVTTLPGVTLAAPEGSANPEIVKAIERLLEKAADGQILAIAWATYDRADTISRGWEYGTYGFHIAAALALLMRDYGDALGPIDAS